MPEYIKVFQNENLSKNRIVSKGVLVNLEEIFQENDLILIDGCMASGSNLSREIYNIRSLNSINRDMIDKGNQNISFFREIIQNEKSFTIKEIGEEFYNYVRHIGNCLNYHSRKENNSRKLRRRASSEIRNVVYSETEEVRETNIEFLRNYQDSLYDIYNLIKRNSLNIKDKRYEILTEIIRLIDNKIGLQKDAGYNYYGKGELPKTSINDDKLVAALYYGCIFLKKKTAILSCDSDFVRIMGITPYLMGAYNFFPYNGIFRDMINESKFNLYIGDANRVKINKRFFEFPLEYEKEFKIRNISDEENNILKSKIDDLWKEIYEIQ